MLRGRLKHAAGWPGRRLLDQRVLWLASLVEDRLGRSDVTVHDRLEDLDRLGRAQLQGLGFLELEAGTPGRRLADLSAPVAGALNWVEGPDGYAAQAGVWFNPPVPVEHRAGGAGVLLVNERIVEQPFVFAHVGAAPRRILDLGGAEATVALLADRRAGPAAGATTHAGPPATRPGVSAAQAAAGSFCSAAAMSSTESKLSDSRLLC